MPHWHPMPESSPSRDPAGSGLASDIRAEAERLGAAIVARGLAAGLMGGLAIWLRCPSVRQAPFARPYQDLDLATSAKSAPGLKALLEAEGYLPDKFFNGLHGATRLYYAAPDERWSVDIVVDMLRMSHQLDLRGRLAEGSITIPLADLLLTKLQIWEINHKDLVDVMCILADHPLSEDDTAGEGISLPRFRTVLGADWGFCHTVERNLGKVLETWAEQPAAKPSFDVAVPVQALLGTIGSAPKSFAWRARARVGERVRWYETPEEVGH